MNYPDANGPKGSQLVPEAAAGFPKVSNGGKVYDFTVNAGFTKFSNGRACDRCELQGGIRPRCRSEDAVTGAAVLLGHRRLATSRRSRASRSRASHLVITLTKAAPDFLARMAMPFFCAIPTNLPHDPQRRARAAVGRPVLHLGSRPEQVDHDQAEPELQGQAPAQRDADQLHHRQLARRARIFAPSRARRDYAARASRRRRTPRPHRSTA